MRRNFHHIFDKRGYCIYFITSAYHFLQFFNTFLHWFFRYSFMYFFFFLFRYCFLILLFFVCLFQTYFDIDFYHTLFLIFFFRQCFVLIGTIHKACPHIRGERGEGSGKSGQMWTGGRGWLGRCVRPLCKKIQLPCLWNLHRQFGSISVYKIFILLVFSRECMKRNAMTSFRILSSFECFLRYFQTEWSVFFFILQCELFTSCNVSNNASIMSARTEGGARGGGGGGPNLCGHPLWMTPSQANFYSLPLFSS